MISLLSCQAADAQAVKAPTGTFYINGRAKAGTKTVTLKKKRFYLLRGGLEANRPLIDKIKSTRFTSRDCFYCQKKASTELIAWMKAGDGGCDSPYCRDVTTEDIAKVPEFQAAHQKGLTQFKKKPVIADRWLLVNLDRSLLFGFFDERKRLVDDILTAGQSVMSAITDNGTSTSAIFVNIPLKSEAAEKFVFSNIVPIEINNKAYVWICETDIGSAKLVKSPILDAPDTSKVIKKCEVIVHDLPVCNAGTCEQK